MLKIDVIEIVTGTPALNAYCAKRKCCVSGELITQEDFDNAISELTITQTYFASLDAAVSKVNT